jgi:hypothetical protein
VHLVSYFPQGIRKVREAKPAAGDESLPRDRRLASAAAQTVADVVARWWVNYDGTSRGLRGGRWSYHGNRPVVFELDGVRFVQGVPVSGKVRWFRYQGRIQADVRVEGPEGLAGRVLLGWDAHEQLGQATLRGRIGGRLLRATMLAP